MVGSNIWVPNELVREKSPLWLEVLLGNLLAGPKDGIQSKEAMVEWFPYLKGVLYHLSSFRNTENSQRQLAMLVLI